MTHYTPQQSFCDCTLGETIFFLFFFFVYYRVPRVLPSAVRCVSVFSARLENIYVYTYTACIYLPYSSAKVSGEQQRGRLALARCVIAARHCVAAGECLRGCRRTSSGLYFEFETTPSTFKLCARLWLSWLCTTSLCW